MLSWDRDTKKTWTVWPLHSDLAWIVSGSYQPGKGEVGDGGGNWGDREAWYYFNSPVLNGEKHWNALFQSQMLGEERRDSSVISIMHSGLYGSSTVPNSLFFLYNVSFLIFITYLWLTPLIILVGDQRGSWAVRITPRRNWFGFCTSGWVEVSVWLRVYSWSQATRRIWN